MRAAYIGYFVMLAVSFVGGAALWIGIASSATPFLRVACPTIALLVGVTLMVEGVALASDWRGISTHFQTLGQSPGTTSPLVRGLIWVPSWYPIQPRTAFRLAGVLCVPVGAFSLAMFALMLAH
jgi:hypothetical protein